MSGIASKACLLGGAFASVLASPLACVVQLTERVGAREGSTVRNAGASLRRGMDLKRIHDMRNCRERAVGSGPDHPGLAVSVTCGNPPTESIGGAQSMS